MRSARPEMNSDIGNGTQVVSDRSVRSAIGDDSDIAVRTEQDETAGFDVIGAAGVTICVENCSFSMRRS